MLGILRIRNKQYLPEDLLPEQCRGKQGEARYFVEVAQFGLSGRAIWNGFMADVRARRAEADFAALAALRAGVVDFRTPHADGTDRIYLDDRNNVLVYEDWDEDLVEWVLGLVNDLNRVWKPEAEAAAEVEDDDADAEGADEDEEDDDELGNLSGSPSEPSAATPPDASGSDTPAPPPSSTAS